MKPTGIVRDAVYLKHEMGDYHPESPQRLQVIYDMIDEIGSGLNLREISSRQASHEELGTAHDPRYVAYIAATAGCDDTFLDPDTSACAHSWDAAARAAGGLFSLIDSVMGGVVRNGFALVRPPGHHAERRRAMGFCLFNNVAVAGLYAIKQHGLERVAIVDWDLHHGNGTQNCFYEDPRVLFISTHQYPHYPGTGTLREVGHGAGEGYTINVPMAAGAGDREYLTVFHMLAAPVLEAFRPQMILLSAGFDAHHSDPLGGMNVTEDGYEEMLKVLMRLASEVCEDRLVLTLEGGYNLNALRNSVERLLKCLSEYNPDKGDAFFDPPADSLSATFRSRFRDVLSIQRKYWPILPDSV